MPLPPVHANCDAFTEDESEKGSVVEKTGAVSAHGLGLEQLSAAGGLFS